MVATLGCSCESAADRQARRDAHKRGVKPTPIDVKLNNTVEAVGLGITQRAQVKARAQAFRELAQQFRDKKIHTLFELNDAYPKYDHAARVIFDGAIGQHMEKDFSGGATDDLPANSAEIFDKYATEFESILK